MFSMKIRQIGESFGSVARTRLRVLSSSGRLRPCYAISCRAVAPIKPVARFLVAVARLVRPRLRLSNFNICLIGAALGLGLALILFRDFIFSPGLVYYTDLYWPYSSHLYPDQYTWDQFSQNAVNNNLTMLYLFLYLFPPELAERLFVILIFTIMGLSMFFATFKLTAPRHRTARVPLLASTLATLVFIINPIVCIRVMHSIFLWFYAFLPLLLYFSYTTFKDIGSLRKMGFLKNAIIIALILLLMSVCLRIYFYFIVVLLAFFAGFSRPCWDYIKRSCVFVGLTLALYIVFSAVWILPLITSSPTVSGFYVMQRDWMPTWSGKGVSMLDTFRLHPIWEMSKIEGMFTADGMLSTLWDTARLAIPIIAFASLLFRRSKLIIWLALFSVAFIFLAKGINPPLGDIYEWIMFEAPKASFYGWAFRIPCRWNILLMFCYSIMIGLTISYFLGWVRDRINRSKLTKVTSVILTMFVIAVLCLSGYPLLGGDLSGKMKPQELPKYWVEFNQWMGQDSQDCKVTYWLKPPRWGSPKPTLGYTMPYFVFHMPVGQSYLLRSIDYERTTRFGELQSPINAKYVVVRGDLITGGLRDKVLRVLSEQQDMEPVQKFGPLYVYENKAPLSPVEASAQSILLVGGLENMLSLTAVDAYDLTDSPIVILDQLTSNGGYLPAADIMVSNLGILDLYLSMLEEEYIIKPFAAVDRSHCSNRPWTKATAEDYLHGEWHYYLRYQDMENWQYDYGEGLVFCPGFYGACCLDTPFRVGEDGDYDVLVRYYQSDYGNMLKVLLDGSPLAEIQTKSQVNQLLWQDIGTFELEKGEHTLTLDGGKGWNAVNLFAVLPHGRLEQYKEQLDDVLADKRIVHIYEAESALYRLEAEPSGKYGGSASKGNVLDMSPNASAHREFEIVRSDEYRLAVKLNGSASVTLDDQVFHISTNELDFAYLDQIYLEKGEHRIEVNAIGDGNIDMDVIWLYSVEGQNETVGDIFNVTEPIVQVIDYEKINPTKYKVRVSASAPFMLSLSEAYNGQWEAHVNGKVYPSMPLNSISNGFWIEEEGELEITIEFMTQRWFYWGAIISGVSIFCALAFLFWNWKRKKWQWLRQPRACNINSASGRLVNSVVHRFRKDNVVSE